MHDAGGSGCPPQHATTEGTPSHSNSLIMPCTMPSERVQRQIDDLLDQAEQAVDDGGWGSRSGSHKKRRKSFLAIIYFSANR